MEKGSQERRAILAGLTKTAGDGIEVGRKKWDAAELQGARQLIWDALDKEIKAVTGGDRDLFEHVYDAFGPVSEMLDDIKDIERTTKWTGDQASFDKAILKKNKALAKKFNRAYDTYQKVLRKAEKAR
jgi:hypothetical protein